MQDILFYLPLLAIAIVCNIMTGLYYNVSVQNIKFDKNVLINGIIKAVIVGGSFIGLTYIFQSLPQLTESIGFDPKLVMISAITLYSTKALASLAKILGVNVEK